MIAGITAGAGMRIDGEPVEGIDPHAEAVVARLRFDGNILDDKGAVYSSTGAIAYVAGHMRQCLSLSGVGSGGVFSNAVNTSLDFPGDFTIELWLRTTTAVARSSALVSRFELGLGAPGWLIFLESGGGLGFYQFVGGASYPIRNAGPDLRDGAWHHIAVTREGSAVRIFVDKVLVDSGTSSSNYTATASCRISIGYQAQGNDRYALNGDIDEVRLTKGVARSVAAFLS